MLVAFKEYSNILFNQRDTWLLVLVCSPDVEREVDVGSGRKLWGERLKILPAFLDNCVNPRAKQTSKYPSVIFSAVENHIPLLLLLELIQDPPGVLIP